MWSNVVIVGIDASNIRTGGGVTHLVELLLVAEPFVNGFSRVVVWGGKSTLNRIAGRPWLVKSHQDLLEKGLFYRTFWQRFRLSKLARVAGCDVLFIPGGSYAGDFQPIVTMSQNMLPFEWQELRRYGWSLMASKMMLLCCIQSRTFHRANGLMFLTQYAHDEVMRVVKTTAGRTAIIPLGVDDRFASPPRKQLPITRYSVDRPFHILYVSIIEVYKHQWHVAKAVAQLRQKGLPVTLELVGPAYPPALKHLTQTLSKVDPTGEFVQYSGAVPHGELHARYAEADMCLFASSCENMPNILLEAMAAGLPLACSNRGPMPEVLGDAGVYFDPEKPAEIATAISILIDSPALREEKAEAAYRRVQDFTWERCARETFHFLAQVAAGYGK